MTVPIVPVVVAYNCPTELSACLQSLSSQNVVFSDIIIVDNSTDPRCREINKIVIENCSFTRYLYVRSAQNTGSAGGFALGMESALDRGAEWLWLLDQDGTVASHCTSVVLKYLDNPDVVICPSVWDNKNYKELYGFRCVANNFGRIIPLYQKSLSPVEIDYFGTHGVLISKKVVKEVGFYDSCHFFVGLEDYEYSLRIRNYGFKIMKFPQARVYHPNLQDKRGLVGNPMWMYIISRIVNFLPASVGNVYKKDNTRVIAGKAMFWSKRLNKSQKTASILFSLVVCPLKKIFQNNYCISLNLKYIANLIRRYYV